MAEAFNDVSAQVFIVAQRLLVEPLPEIRYTQQVSLTFTSEVLSVFARGFYAKSRSAVSLSQASPLNEKTPNISVHA